MACYKMIVMVNATEGQDDAFNQWYDERHLADVCAVPGVVSGQRYTLAAGVGTWRYLTIYEAETDDPSALLAEVGRRAGTPAMEMTDAIDVRDPFIGLFASNA